MTLAIAAPNTNHLYTPVCGLPLSLIPLTSDVAIFSHHCSPQYGAVSVGGNRITSPETQDLEHVVVWAFCRGQQEGTEPLYIFLL